MTTYRFTMTVTRVAEYEIDATFDGTPDDDALYAYGQELMPYDMTEVDETTLDMTVSYEQIDPADAAAR